MSLHNNKRYNTPEVRSALKSNGFRVDGPSQLSDAFRLGWAACSGELSIAGLTVTTDPTMPEDQIKFVHPDARVDRFKITD